MSANEHIDELLSGFLDGELTAEELREVQAAMAADSQLAVKAEQLRQLGSELRGLPQRKLPANFSARVLAAAQAEANRIQVSESNSGTSAYVASSSDSMFVSPAKQSSPATSTRSWRSAAISLVAVAASLLGVAYLSGWIGGSGGSSGSNTVPEYMAGEVKSGIPSENTSGDVDSADLQLPDMQPSTDALVNSEVEAGGALVGNQRPKPSSTQFGFEMLTVLEIQPSEAARNANLIATILKQAGIEWSAPVTASSDVVKVLNSTRSINPGAGKGSDDQVALVLVRAPSTSVDKAMNMIWERDKDFPFFSMDVAFDLPGKDLVRKLLEAQKPVVGDSQSLATPILVTGVASDSLEDMAHFSSAPRHFVTSNERSKPIASGLETGMPVTAEEEEAPTLLLLVIRKPAE